MEEISPLKSKICKSCGIEKPIKKFHKTKGISDGYSARCTSCKYAGIKIEKHKIKTGRPKDMILPFGFISEHDYKLTYEFLRRIGYSLDRSIHEQFCERHNLIPTTKKVFKDYYSPKDCGLI